MMISSEYCVEICGGLAAAHIPTHHFLLRADQATLVTVLSRTVITRAVVSAVTGNSVSVSAR
jgi:hypothetical protein